MTSSPGTEPPDPACELDWLLETSALATHPKGWPQPHEGSKRLGRMLTALMDHLGCALGALLIPHQRIRLVQVSNRVNRQWIEEALRGHLDSEK